MNTIADDNKNARTAINYIATCMAAYRDEYLAPQWNIQHEADPWTSNPTWYQAHLDELVDLLEGSDTILVHPTKEDSEITASFYPHPSQYPSISATAPLLHLLTLEPQLTGNENALQEGKEVLFNLAHQASDSVTDQILSSFNDTNEWSDAWQAASSGLPQFDLTEGFAYPFINEGTLVIAVEIYESSSLIELFTE